MALSTYIRSTVSACASSIPAAILTGASVAAARTPQGFQALGKFGVNYFTLGAQNLYKIAAAGFLTSLSIKLINTGLDYIPASAKPADSSKNAPAARKFNLLKDKNWKPLAKNIAAGLISAAVFVRLNSNCKDWKSVNTIVGGVAFFAIQKVSDSITNTTVKGCNKLTGLVKRFQKNIALRRQEKKDNEELKKLLNQSPQTADPKTIEKHAEKLEKINEQVSALFDVLKKSKDNSQEESKDNSQENV